ncbi:hypothetical protein [Nostoc sp.]|uniref:hypothetical protein n=1 Tax=Nostoc sp. TaxID=1180 RepID=UPI002FFCF980
MQRDTIRLTIPLFYAWSEQEDQSARVDIILTSTDNTGFEVIPIGTVANAADKYAQVYWNFTKDKAVNAEIIWRFAGGEISSILQTTKIEAQLELGQIGAPPSESGNWDILLRGSLLIGTDSLTSLPEEWKKRLTQLWPTGNLKDITNLRIEPAGLFLQGKLPSAFFPGEATEVVLRIPQAKSDLVKPRSNFRREDQLVVEPSIDTETRVWTLSTFRFPNLINAKTFVTDRANEFKNFTIFPHIQENRTTFLDNVVCEPDPNCTVRLAVKIDTTSNSITDINWWAEGIGVRLMIAAKGTDETTFYPEALVGSLNRFLAMPWEGNPIAFVSGQPNPDANDLIRLDLSYLSSNSVQFHFQERELAAHVIPSTALQEKSGNLKRDSQNNFIRRAWLCTETGWLSLDATHPQAKLKDAAEIPSSETVTSVLPLDELLSALTTESEVLSGMTVQVEALAESHVAVILSPNATELSLWLTKTKTILKTPSVWYYALRSQGDLEKPNPREEQPVLETLIPSLTAALTEIQSVESLETQLQKVLVAATFFSKNVLDIKENENSLEVPRELITRINWNENDREFVFKFESKGMQLWHYFEGCPLVQEVPLSPVVSRDMFLDANRGLIPYQKRKTDEPVAIVFPTGQLPRLQEIDAPPSPTTLTIKDNNWLVTPTVADQRFFLPTLPGVELQIEKPSLNPEDWKWQWSYRHAVPVLDEAYGEIIEVPPENSLQTPQTVLVELTRIKGATAFTIQSGSGEAKGWLHPTPDNVDGKTQIEISQINLVGLQPRIDFKIQGLNAAFAFQRPRFQDSTTVSELTANLQANLLNNNADLPTFQVNWANNGASELAIVNNGQPLFARWSETLKRLLTLDGEGIVQEEAIGPDRREHHLNQPTLTFRTASYLLKDPNSLETALQLDVVNIPVVPPPNPQPETGQWMLHDGAGTWPVWRGFPLMPLRLQEFQQDSDIITIKLVVILLWRIPEAVSEVSTESTGEITFTFSGSSENIVLTELQGVIDWRFSTLLENQSEEQVFLSRFKAELTTTTPTLPLLKLQEIDLEHPISLLRLRPDLTQTICELGEKELSFIAKRNTPAFTYESESVRLAFPIDVSQLSSRWNFSWFNSDEDTQIRWQLNHDSSKWSFRLERQSMDLIGTLTLKPHWVAARQFLFEISESDSIPVLSESWLKIEQAQGGFIGVEFGLPENVGDADASELVVVDIAGDLQLLLGDSEDRINDAIYIYNPESDELQTIDRDTGNVCEPESLPSFGVTAISQQIFWGTQNGVVKRWNLNNNKVDRKISTGSTDINLELPSFADPPPANTIVQSFAPINPGDASVVFSDQNHELYYWDLNNPDTPLSLGTSKLKNPIDRPNTQFNGILLLTSSQRANPSNSTIAWLRKRVDSSVPPRLYLWNPEQQRTGPVDPNLQPVTLHQADITAVDFLFSTGWIVSGDGAGEIRVWKPQPQPTEPSVAQIMRQGTAITALAVMGTTQQASNLIVSGDSNGKVRLWSRPDDTMPTVFKELSESDKLDRYDLPAGEKVKFLVALGTASLAILSSTGKVTILSIEQDKFVTLDNKEFANLPKERFPRFLDLRGTTAKAIAWMRKDEKDQLIVTGDTVGTRLSGLLKLSKDGEGKLDVQLQATGWLVLENDIHLEEEINKSGTRTTRQCTHKIKIFLDRASLPIDAIYKSIGPATNDYFVAGIVEHTLRLSAGQSVIGKETQQIERTWQAPQLLRFTTMSRFSETFLKRTIADDSRLVLEAGTVFWLQWVSPTQEREFGGASEISNPSLSLFLRSQRLGQLQAPMSSQPEERARVVRLPFASTPMFSSPEFPLATIKIPDRVSPLLKELLHETSGVQPLLLNPTPLNSDAEIEYFRRTTQSRLTSVRPISVTLDALWLDEQFLNQALSPDIADEPLGQVSPVFKDDLSISIPNELNDLIWLRSIQDTPSPLNPGNTITKRQRQTLAAGTLTRKYLPNQGLQTLLGTALFEFPFQILVSDEPKPIASNLHDVQLIGFVEGRLVRLAAERLEGDDERLKDWAQNILITRRRTHGTFILIDFSRVLVIPLGAEATQEELRFAQPWSGLSLAIDVRSRFPRLIPATLEAQKVRFQTSPNLNLLVFDAYPVKPLAPYPGVAATRYRMTPTSSIGSWQLTEDAIDKWKELAEAIKRGRQANTGEDPSFWDRLRTTINNVVLLDDIISDSNNREKQKELLFKLNQALAGSFLYNPLDFATFTSNILEQFLAEEISGQVDQLSEPCQPFFNRRLLEIAVSNAIISRLTLDQHEKRAGSLRPTRIETISVEDKAGGILGYTVREDLPFERTELGLYPRSNARPLTERPLAPIAQVAENNTRSVLPPLVDVVSWSARPGEMSRTTWNLERTCYRPDTVWLSSSNATTVNLRRPRAIAGKTQSVRFSFLPDKPATTVFGNRFSYARLLLTQVLDRTGQAELESSTYGVYAVLVTKNELFRGATTFERASQTPALIYGSASKLEPFELYLIVDTQKFNPSSNSPIDSSKKEKTLLLWTMQDISPGTQPPSDGDPTILLNVDDPTLPGWENVFGSIWTKRISFDQLKANMPPSDSGISLTLVHYGLNNLSDPTQFQAESWAVVKLNQLDSEGRLRSPKMSVSILAYPEDSDSIDPVPAILAGYGRLSDDDLSPIRPIAVVASQTLEWSRTAGLQTLHRVSQFDAQKTYHYDGIVYGAGGEVFPTEPNGTKKS